MKGLGPVCQESFPITNCHYANDTIIFFEADEHNIERAWWTMLAFEALSGIRMNLQKTELFSFNNELGPVLAKTFRCQFASFPLKYLGLPLHKSKLAQKDWDFILAKFDQTLQNWKGQMLSIGGRLTLINSVLSSIPLYTLSLFQIPTSVLKKLDRI